MANKYYNQPCDVTIGGAAFHFESLLEYRWAQYLEILRIAGEIDAWGYETPACEFEFSVDFRYIIDFVTYKGKDVVYYECKGMIQARDMKKWRRLAEEFPEVKLILVVERRQKQQFNKLRQAEKYVERIIERYKACVQCPIDMSLPQAEMLDTEYGRRKRGQK